jgi:hypothetical protein
MAWLLQQQGTQLSASTMYAAALEGHTAMCQYLRAQQCPWDARSTCAAAEGGQLDVLRYLVDNGCPWDVLLPMYCCLLHVTALLHAPQT